MKASEESQATAAAGALAKRRGPRPTLALVTPALPAAHNGNGQTAGRWARLLADDYRVQIMTSWTGQPADAMVALHARRSAASIQAWRAAAPRWPLVVVLTGTDLYRDLQTPGAPADDVMASLRAADAIVVLNSLAPARLPEVLRSRTHVVLQSCAWCRPRPRPQGHLRVLAVGHLRDEKDPRTVFAAMRLLSNRPDIRLDHLGDELDPALGDEARALAAAQTNYRWLGALLPAEVRTRMAAAHVLMHPSRMEGGAHAVIEAVRSGLAVLASRIDGNVGLLGTDYPGFVEPGDAVGFARRLQQLRDEPAMLADWTRRAQALAPRFEPAQERQSLRTLLASLC